MAEGMIGLFGACVQAVFAFGLLCVPGGTLGYTGFFTKEFIGSLAQLNVNLAIPALILSNVGAKLRLEEIGYLSPLLAFSTFQLTLGLIAAFLVFRMVGSCCPTKARLSPAHSRVLPVVAAVQNCVGFTLPVAQSACKSRLTALEPDACFQQTVIEIFVYNVVWQLTVWTLVYGILKRVAATAPENLPEARQVLLADAVGVEEGSGKMLKSPQLGRCELVCASCSGFAAMAKPIVNPALCSLALSMVIVAIPSLQRAMFEREVGIFSCVANAIETFGSIVPVIAALLLSASLGRSIRSSRDRAAGERTELVAVPTWAVITVIVIRLVVVPFAGLVALFVFNEGFPVDGTMRLVIGLQLGSPGATVTIVMCQQLGMISLADSLAGLYVPMLLFCFFTVPVWLSAALYLA